MSEKNRLIDIVLGDINNCKLKCEEELEQIINNNNVCIDEKVVRIKGLLIQIKELNDIAVLWAGYTTPVIDADNNNNNNNNNT